MPTSRRVTTGIEEGESRIIADEPVHNLNPYARFPSFQLQNLFYTEDLPQSLNTRHLPTPYTKNLPPSALRIVKIRMPTQAEKIADFHSTGQTIPEDWTTFNLARSHSADYIYVLSGAITCMIGKQPLHLKAGDFLAQIGPDHTWINDHNEPCYLLCVMIGMGDEQKE